MNAVLEIADLHVTYAGRSGTQVAAVAGVDLTVQSGTITALVGESGCGKSSLGKAAIGLIARSAGTVTFDGRAVTPLGRGRRDPHLCRLQMVFQDPSTSLNPRRTVADLITEAGESATRAGLAAMPVGECLERVGLPAQMAGRFAHQLSGGQRQRIAIARALAAKPKCVIADEPISALDASAQASIALLLQGLSRDLDLGILFISHDLSIVQAIADVTSVMYLGRIVETGESRNLWQKPAHPYTQALIAAIPRADGQAHIPRRLEGDAPRPAQPPSGCRFHPRCQQARPECATLPPAMIQLSPEHRTACHLHGSARAPR